MEAASSLAASASDGHSAAKKKRKRGERKAKEAANKRKRRKTLSSGGLADGEEEEDDNEDEEEDDTPELRWRRSAASRLVLSALRRCFQSDRSGFVNKARFDLLLPAVVAQLDCGSDFSAASAGSSGPGGETEGTDEVSSCRLHAEELVGPCLAQLASASGKDALWKTMANAVLMKTRSKRAGVRVAALVSLRQCFEVIGEEFLALLPECLPFLSELLEVRQMAHLSFGVRACMHHSRDDLVLTCQTTPNDQAILSDRRIFPLILLTHLTGWPSGGGGRMSRVGQVHRRNTGGINRELPRLSRRWRRAVVLVPTRNRLASIRPRDPVYSEVFNKTTVVMRVCRCPKPLSPFVYACLAASKSRFLLFALLRPLQGVGCGRCLRVYHTLCGW